SCCMQWQSMCQSLRDVAAHGRKIWKQTTESLKPIWRQHRKSIYQSQVMNNPCLMARGVSGQVFNGCPSKARSGSDAATSDILLLRQTAFHTVWLHGLRQLVWDTSRIW